MGGLAKGALGTFEAAILGIAGTAPTFSVAVTTAAIVAAVGVLSVGAILYCGLIMFGIMLSFFHLSKITPHAGASYAWVGHVFGKYWGFFAGWGMLVASIFFMVSATIPAATSTLLLLAPERVEDTVWVTNTAAIWLTLVSVVVTLGVKGASITQAILTGIEALVVLALIIAAFIAYGGQPAHPPSLIWVSPFSFTPQVFATGALIAIFFYWGWDVTMNLSEESRGGEVGDRVTSTSHGAMLAMVNLILFFILMMVVVLIVLTDAEIAEANTNVLYAIATKLFPEPWNYLAVLCTLLSTIGTIGTIDTQIMQFSRGMFAMARDDMLHPRYASIHARWQTPWVAGVLLLFSSSFMPSVKDILQSSILAIGFQICFYMSLAGFACAWHYRGKLKEGLRAAVSYVIWPLLGACFMVFISVYSVPNFDLLTNLLGLGGLLLGVIPLWLGASRRRGA